MEEKIKTPEEIELMRLTDLGDLGDLKAQTDPGSVFGDESSLCGPVDLGDAEELHEAMGGGRDTLYKDKENAGVSLDDFDAFERASRP